MTWDEYARRRSAMRRRVEQLRVATYLARARRVAVDLAVYGTAFWRETELGPYRVPPWKVVLLDSPAGA